MYAVIDCHSFYASCEKLFRPDLAHRPLAGLFTLFEPKYIDGKAHRYGIEREDDEPITVAALYEIVKIGEQIIRSMTMLTINADNHPFMSQFHKPEDKKRSILVIELELEHRKDWLNIHHEDAFKLLLPMGGVT